ncbi:glycoside hydrolase family 43 protein [Pseudovirgaria hyperparasitica]|uniref:Glycoside hydrolase family 43 protein n=1 Tax=Pseudovirgaria hyperparasitica TaxID=470096 RepID=A0A6A6WLL8_9PEZI|nr:glycoside hydrolase family 43 protein [Pseudovirgaria hyperparasitica]KAF2762899.1 glycoside hydrolase family 43 protein [Pseudovirgaria hyperparasitica]
MLLSIYHILATVVSVFTLVHAAKYSNPLKEVDGADPFIVWHDGFWYLTTTTSPTIQITRAKNLESLKTGEHKIVFSDTEPSRKCDLWAPEIHLLDGNWYLYYSASACDTDSNRLHVLKGGSSPWDPYSYLGQMSSEWGIDGSVLIVNKRRYFMFSCRDGPSQDQSLCIATLEEPGRLGERRTLSQPSAPWERNGFPVNEGPTAMYKDGRTYIAFSASHCSTANYTIGILEYRGNDPLDMANWVKSGPHFETSNGNNGPGHNSFFLSPDQTQWWNIFHATPDIAGNCGSNRYTSAQIVDWWMDGTPDLGVPEPLGTVYDGPSGEE